MTDYEMNIPFDKKKIYVHHVGGRGGRRSFPITNEFEGDVVNVLYDADADCISKIMDKYRDFPSQSFVLPYCVGQSNRKMNFSIKYDPYTSSLMEFDPKFNDFYYCHNDIDWIWYDVAKTMEIRELEVNSLDNIFGDEKIRIPPPDFLSLDTQGAEYEILSGGERTLQSNVVALIVEVEFQPVYREQKLFGDICKILSDNHFDFVKLLDVTEYSPFRAPVGLRGEGFELDGNALFLRRYDSIDPSTEEGQIMLHKLAFFSIVFNQIEYALLCLNHAENRGNKNVKDILKSSEYKYLVFINEFKGAAREIPLCYPPKFSDKYSVEMSKTRHDTNKLISKSGMAKRILLSLENRMNSIIFKFNDLTPHGKKYRAVEKLFKKYSLHEQAEIVRAKRKKQQKYCRL